MKSYPMRKIELNVLKKVVGFRLRIFAKLRKANEYTKFNPREPLKMWDRAFKNARKPAAPVLSTNPVMFSTLSRYRKHIF